jgi:hypothetical protein
VKRHARRLLRQVADWWLEPRRPLDAPLRGRVERFKKSVDPVAVEMAAWAAIRHSMGGSGVTDSGAIQLEPGWAKREGLCGDDRELPAQPNRAGRGRHRTTRKGDSK